MPHPALRRLASASAVLLLTGASAFAADPQLLNLAMPDAQVMAGINVVTARISPFGQFLLNKIATTGQTGLQTFINQTGFDPTKDVSEILAASSGNAASPSGLLLARGTFNVSALVAALQNQKGGATVSNYGGATLITAAGGATVTHALAFLGGSIAIAGDLTSVKAAVDRSAGVNSISPTLAAQVQTLSTTEDAWSVSIASLGALIPGGMAGAGGTGAAQPLQLVKNIQSASSGIKFGGNVQFTAQAVADTAANATSLADVIKMITGLVAMGAAGQDTEAAAIAALLQSVQVTTSDATVNISATVPESQLEAVLNTAAVKKEDAVKLRKM